MAQQSQQVLLCACPSTVGVGAAVKVSAEGGTIPSVIRCDYDDIDTMPASGIVESKPSPSLAVVRLWGEMPWPDALPALYPGANYWVGGDGVPSTTLTEPASGLRLEQRVGVALAERRLFVTIEPIRSGIGPA